MFVGVLKAIKGVKIEVEQKKSFLADIHRVNMGLRGLGCGQYKRTTFKGFLCIFLKILAKDMGKPLVPAVPTLFGHLGHPTQRVVKHSVKWDIIAHYLGPLIRV